MLDMFCIIHCINSLVPAPVRVMRADTGKSGHNPDHDTYRTRNVITYTYSIKADTIHNQASRIIRKDISSDFSIKHGQ